MRTEAGIFFSRDCPASGSYKGPVAPENFELILHDCTLVDDDPTETELVGAFSSGVDQVSTDIGRVHPVNSVEARHYWELDERYSVTEIGAFFCANIAACKGPEVIDGPAHCPAFNNIELRKLM